MAKVFTPLIRDGVDPERKSILLEDFLAWLLDRAEDNLASVTTGNLGPDESQSVNQTQQVILDVVEQFLNDRTALGLSS
jgi:hypothetical protein